MSSLREIKNRIASVKSTLKITSAMKLVASSKLRKAQKAIENLRPYEEMLSGILVSLKGGLPVAQDGVRQEAEESGSAGTLIVAISSNSSLCGGFNANVIKKAYAEVKACDGPVEVVSIGRKMADFMRKAGYPCAGDYSELVSHSSYEACSELAGSIASRYYSGKLSRVVLVYNHFVSTSKQVPVVENYLPFEMDSNVESSDFSDYIIEPSAKEVVEQLLPQVLMMKFYAAILDSLAAEHAARTIAMQTATDNGEELLSDLTLEYNKGRQQKITSEILDLVGGAQQ